MRSPGAGGSTAPGLHSVRPFVPDAMLVSKLGADGIHMYVFLVPVRAQIPQETRIVHIFREE